MTAKSKYTKWLEKYLAPLVGAKITKVEVRQKDGEAWPVLTIDAPKDGVFELVLSRDDEGNGPGAILGLPNPAARKKLT